MVTKLSSVEQTFPELRFFDLCFSMYRPDWRDRHY